MTTEALCQELRKREKARDSSIREVVAALLRRVKAGNGRAAHALTLYAKRKPKPGLPSKRHLLSQVRNLLPTETDVQARFVKAARRLPGVIAIHHSPNEGKRGRRAQRAIKRLGLSPGFPDILILIEAAPHVVGIEMKRAHFGTTTAQQKQWGEHFAAASLPWKCCYGDGEAMAFLRSVLDGSWTP